MLEEGVDRIPHPQPKRKKEEGKERLILTNFNFAKMLLSSLSPNFCIGPSKKCYSMQFNHSF